MSLRLSVIVLTFNQQAVTMRLLKSMESWLKSNDDVELIIVDNGSNDGTVNKIESWRREFEVQNVSTIVSSENIGVAAGRNLGLKNAQGEVVMLLDNDTICDGVVYDKLAGYVLETPGCGIASPALYSPEGELQASAKPYPSLWLKLQHVLSPGEETVNERKELGKRHPYYVIGACQVFRRDLLNKIGYLDSGIFYGPEDCDFCIRTRRAGYSIDYLSELRLVHDWRRVTRMSPFSFLGKKHILGLLRFWLRHPIK